jgi:alpha-2-macroglobulin
MSPVSLRHLLVGLLISVSLVTFSGEKPDWIDIDRLISEHKFAEALQAVDGLLEKAKTSGDAENWTKAVVRGAQLRMGLHGYEEAVRFLREQPRPDGLLSQAILNLYHGQTLATYYSAYSWEINQREFVSGEAGDVKTWTKEQIVAEATAAYEKVWAHRDQLGSEPLGRISEYVAPNNYPEGIRDTVRDAVSYLFVELLANTSLWKPEEENELYQLSAADLAGSAEPDHAAEATKGHPLVRLIRLLKDLEAWHAARGRPEAALEARLERMRRLHAAFQQESDRTAIRTALEAVLSGYRDHAWWAMGQALLSEMVSQQSESGKLVRARAIAEAGHQAYPASPGGRRCLNLVRSIEAPHIQISSMAADGPQKRSIQVSHRNLSKVFFRAYRADLMQCLASSRDYQLLLDGDARWKLARSTSPVAECATDLPATPDFETHRTFLTPPLNKAGYYVILASLHRDFDKTPGNTMVSINFVVSDLVVLTRRHWGLDHLEVQVLWGETGKPAPGARVDLYRLDWQRGHRPVRRSVAGADGSVLFGLDEKRSSYFVVARLGGQVALDPQHIYAYSTREKRPLRSAIVFTDRSIYRPGQKILWKILAYSGIEDEADFRPLTGSEVKVRLLDANGQEVASRIVRTNAFGTAAGEFAVAAGRMLGAWNLQALDGSARVRVEEYKRPTFEASLKDPDSALRLNRPAVVKGEARYYFGLPLTTGMVQWRVTREPVYPWWWGWYGWDGGAKARTVAAGTSELSDEGSFEVPFTPGADEREAKNQISYRYKVTADVIDEGGETQSAERSFRIGFVSVEARIEPEKSFFRATDPVLVRITRSDLNQAPRPGKGSWRLVLLEQPKSAVPPADLPLPGRPDEDEQARERFQTPGDRQRPRWDPGYSGRREMLSWADGAEKERGELDHDSRGVGLVELPSLEAGAYRLHYSTNDEHGQPFQASLELIVSGQRARLALPAFFLAQQQSCKVGETARFLAVSGLEDQTMFFEVYRSGRLKERRQLNSNRDSHLIEIPITEADRGGFSTRLVVVRDHQLMEFQERTMVPWDHKELEVRFSTFRDKLRPGGEETWRVTIRDPSGKEVGKDAAEVLAYMYDRSLDVFAPHRPPSPLSLWPLRMDLGRTANQPARVARRSVVARSRQSHRFPGFPGRQAAALRGSRNWRTRKAPSRHGTNGGPGVYGIVRRLRRRPSSRCCPGWEGGRRRCSCIVGAAAPGPAL